MSDLNTAVHWSTSSYSGNGSQCVEVAVTADAMGVRDTKHRGDGPELWVRPTAARAFLTGVVNGTLGG